MQTTSPIGLALIKRFEGFSPVPYLCPAGYWTIGYGHVLKSGQQSGQQDSSSPFRRKPESITEAEAERLLREDILGTERAVRRLLPVALTQNQFDALVSFTYNLGSGALQRSTLRQKALRLDHPAAAREFPKWIYAGGRKLPGLLQRRLTEANLYSSDI